ncbi:MAG: DUF952 domain-containing protein [Pseudobdellovibrionaceae bacterium]|jgi:uncharacterized protein (DUF952 family)
MKTIYHITLEDSWSSAKKYGKYSAPSLEKEGFIHCSLADQIPRVADFNFKGQQGLIILEIDVARLNCEVKFEDLYGDGEKFPHIYGKVNVDAVLRIASFPPNSDGTFNFPKNFNLHY